MSQVTEEEGGGKLKKQKTLEDWTVAKVPQWSKAGLMEHIVELVVVDDQVRTVRHLCNNDSCSILLCLDTFQAFSLVDREAFRRILKFQRPSTNDRDIPHRTSVANAVHEKAHKVRVILKGLFAVRIITIVRV